MSSGFDWFVDIMRLAMCLCVCVCVCLCLCVRVCDDTTFSGLSAANSGLADICLEVEVAVALCYLAILHVFGYCPTQNSIVVTLRLLRCTIALHCMNVTR